MAKGAKAIWALVLAAAAAAAGGAASPKAASRPADTSAAGASSRAALPPAPRLVFEETVHEFGVIRQGDVVEHEFVFRNEGTETLRIRNLRPSCGCTASTVSSPLVGPGETGAILVRFDSKGKIGRIRKTVVVESNDPAGPQVLVVWSRVVAPKAHADSAADTAAASRMMGPGGGRAALAAGASLFAGECKTCHFDPARGLRGRPLYEAVCAMCHGDAIHPAISEAPALTGSTYLETKSDTYLRFVIANGTGNPMMPGFAAEHGGPLDSDQLESLVAYFRLIRPNLPAENVPPTPHHE